MVHRGTWCVPALLGLLGAGLVTAGGQAPPSGAEPTRKTSPAPLTAGPKQPLPFSHRAHLALGLSCTVCHASKRSDHTIALPTTAVCMACHQTIDKDKPAIRELATYARENRPIPWLRVYSVPGWVYWSHESHLKAGLQCADCHGNVSKMDVIFQAKNVTTMKGCTTCHQQRHVLSDCHSCHDVGSN